MKRLPRISVSGDIEGDYVVLTRRVNGALIVAPAQLHGVPVVTSLRRTSTACPSQWEGVLDDGRALYARFRHGELSVGVGEGIQEAVRSRGPDEALLREDVGDGFMTFEDLRTYLYGLVDFSPDLEVEGEREQVSSLTGEIVSANR
jgi:hypothetical protein